MLAFEDSGSRLANNPWRLLDLICLYWYPCEETMRGWWRGRGRGNDEEHRACWGDNSVETSLGSIIWEINRAKIIYIVVIELFSFSWIFHSKLRRIVKNFTDEIYSMKAPVFNITLCKYVHWFWWRGNVWKRYIKNWPRNRKKMSLICCEFCRKVEVNVGERIIMFEGWVTGKKCHTLVTVYIKRTPYNLSVIQLWPISLIWIWSIRYGFCSSYFRSP